MQKKIVGISFMKGNRDSIGLVNSQVSRSVILWIRRNY